MRQRIRSRLTYANVVATLALFLVLGGGTALASYVVSSNSQIGPGTVSGHKPPSGEHANIIRGSINEQDLGVPLKFTGAGLTDDCNGVSNGWSNQQPNFANRAAYARDAFGVVHLHGLVEPCGSPPTPTMFTLPPGYRPAKEEFLWAGAPTIYGNGFVNATDSSSMSLDGITFRCAPSGKNGCP